MSRAVTMTERFAEHVIEMNASSAVDARDSFRDELMEDFCDNLQAGYGVEMSVDEFEALEASMNYFLDGLMEDVDELVNEWNRDAADEADDIRRAARGEY